MAAQARAAAMQNLPAVCNYTGEGKDVKMFQMTVSIIGFKRAKQLAGVMNRN